jgi:capsular polysaccharide biosynthesis protein
MPHGDDRRLDRDDFAFRGFAGFEPALDAALAPLRLRDGEPAVAVVEDAVFVPASRAAATDPTHGRFAVDGGIVAPDGRSLEAAVVRRRGTRWGDRVLGGVPDPAAVQPLATIDAEVVYLGWYFDQFGHFLLESLARAWVLDRVDPAARVAFHTVRAAIPAGTRKRILESFGIPPERILAIDRPTRIRRLLVPDALYAISTGAHRRLPEPFRRVAAAATGDLPRTDQPVYLSRRLLPGSLRQVVGEAEFEDVLRENGVLVAHPETMTFEDQVALWNRHRHVVTTVGSAAHAVLFAYARPALHLLCDGVPREDYFLVPKAAEAETTYVNALGRGGKPFIDNRTPVEVDIPAAAAYLEERGFLRRRLRSAIAARRPPRSFAFHEAWCYAAVLDVIPHGEPLPANVEREARDRAATSWPVSWILARYGAGRGEQVDELVRRFAELAGAEADSARIARYHPDVASMAPRVAKACGPETASVLNSVLADTFGTTVERDGRRRARGATE